MADFLLEIGCEEIPARMIDAASEELRERVGALLVRERLAGGQVTSFDTPRRLAVMVSGIAGAQADVIEQLAEEHVLAQAGRALCTPGALAGGDAG